MHPKIPVIPYQPSGGPKFISGYDPNTGGILSDEIHVADQYLNVWAHSQGQSVVAAINRFFNPTDKNVMPAYTIVQVSGLDKFFDDLPQVTADAINYGTNAVRFAMSTMLPATDSEHEPVNFEIAAPTKTSGTNAGDSYPVSWNVEGSVFKWRLDCAQRHLNTGG